MLNYVLVIFEQQLRGQLREIKELRRERVVKVVDVVLVQPFERFAPQVLGQILEMLHVEEG